MGFNDILAQLKARRAATPVGYGTVAGVQAAGDAAIDQARGWGTTATSDYLDRARSFDASQALNKYATGAWNSISAGLKDTLADESGAAVGAGRFDSGFYDEDRGRIINRATDQFSNAVAGQAMSAASLQQSNDAQLGQFGQRATEDANDLLAARSEQVQNDAREEAERRRRRRSGIGAAIGTTLGAAAGSFFPGVGTAIGAKAGAAIGGSF